MYRNAQFYCSYPLSATFPQGILVGIWFNWYHVYKCGSVAPCTDGQSWAYCWPRLPGTSFVGHKPSFAFLEMNLCQQVSILLTAMESHNFFSHTDWSLTNHLFIRKKKRVPFLWKKRFGFPLLLRKLRQVIESSRNVSLGALGIHTYHISK